MRGKAAERPEGSPRRDSPGKVKKLNVVQNELSKSQLIQIQAGSIVVLVFDTDVPKTDCLRRNIANLERKCTAVKTVCPALYGGRKVLPHR